MGAERETACCEFGKAGIQSEIFAYYMMNAAPCSVKIITEMTFECRKGKHKINVSR
jgi:hypothetical protein